MGQQHTEEGEIAGDGLIFLELVAAAQCAQDLLFATCVVESMGLEA